MTKKLDLVLVNEGQDSAALFGELKAPTAPPAKFPVTYPAGRWQTALSADGKPAFARRIDAGGRGSVSLNPRALLAPGAYKLVGGGPDGKPRESPFTVAASPLFLKGE